MSAKEGRPGKSGQNDQQLNDSTISLDPEVCPDGKRREGPDLTPENLQKIAEALPSLDGARLETLCKYHAITPEVVARRGYRRIEKPDQLKWLGFSEKHGPGLFIPIRGISGDIVSCQVRFDSPAETTDPKTQKKRKLRYLSPVDLDQRIDFPGPFLEDRDESVWITEGAKKADSLRSLGKYAICLTGVWNWAGKQARKDLEAVDWTDREVLICFDSDAETNRKVGEARVKLAAFLKKQGAFPRIVRLDSTPDGEKQGVDDFLAQGGTLNELFEKTEEPEPDWKGQLVYSETTGALKVNSWNLRAILDHDPDFSFLVLRFNEMKKTVETSDGAVLDTPRLTELSSQIEGRYGTGAIPVDLIGRVTELKALFNKIHPVREWLESLPEWDGTPRIDRLFIDYYGAKDTAFVRSVGKNLMVAAVARVLKPGVKFDNLVVLEGPQGLFKTASLGVLFGESWFVTNTERIGTKDFLATCLGNWCVELDELAGMRKSMVETVKSCLSTRIDAVRLPYRRDSRKYPRNFIFVGTTNVDDYLQDPTGNRRFWPVRCAGQIDMAGLERDREQLFAEAFYRFKNGESWWEIPHKEAAEEQEARYQSDAWEEQIAPWLLGRWETTTSAILFECLKIEPGRHDRAHQTRIGAILKRLNWEKKRVRTASGLGWVYVPTSEVGTGWNNVGTINARANVPTVPTENYKGIVEHPTMPPIGTYDDIGVTRESFDDLGRNVGTSNTVANSSNPEVGTNREEVGTKPEGLLEWEEDL